MRSAFSSGVTLEFSHSTHHGYGNWHLGKNLKSRHVVWFSVGIGASCLGLAPYVPQPYGIIACGIGMTLAAIKLTIVAEQSK